MINNLTSTIRRKRTAQGGQAIAEMAVCLIALMVVLLGFLLVSSLSHENVTNAILSRQQADKHFRNSQSSVGSQEKNIAYWNYGDRGIPFNGDDKPVTSTSRGGGDFFGELVDNNGRFDFRTAGGNGWLPDEYNPLRKLQQSDLLLDAANLTAGTYSENDPLEKRGLSSLKSAFRNLLGVKGSFQMTDHTFMPQKATVTLPEHATGQ